MNITTRGGKFNEKRQFCRFFFDKIIDKKKFLCHINEVESKIRKEIIKMKEYKVSDVVNMTEQEIDLIQQGINQDNLSVIEEAYQNRHINLTDYEYLKDFYHDGMDVYREVYRALYEVFKHPEYTSAIDLSTGNVDLDYNEQPINYGLKAVTPFTCTRLEYVDKFNNPIYVIFPKMKTAARAIEKLESEYGKEYAEELHNAARYAFELEDMETFREKISNINPSSSKLHDILRLTVTCKYLTDVERIERVMTEQRGFTKRNYTINAAETRNRFHKPLAQNEKKYYDIKMIMHQHHPQGKTLDVEVQLKIHTLYNADLRTHQIYEDIRSIEAELAQKQKDFSAAEVRQKKATIEILTNRIRRINENAIHQYNMMVIDKARRFEDDGYRPLRIAPDYVDGTYQQCRQFIHREYLVESYTPFDPQTAFSAESDVNKVAYLRLIGKLKPIFNEFAEDALEKVEKLFNNLTLAERNRFNGINEVAKRYAPFINRKIRARAAEDEKILNGGLVRPQRER